MPNETTRKSSIIVVAAGLWAKADDKDGAIKKLKKMNHGRLPKCHVVYSVDFETWIDDAGNFVYPYAAQPPEVVERVGFKPNG